MPGMSTWHPGYVLASQTPPTSCAFSNITKFVWPNCRFSWIAAQRPDSPAPTMQTRGVEPSGYVQVLERARAGHMTGRLETCGFSQHNKKCEPSATDCEIY